MIFFCVATAQLEPQPHLLEVSRSHTHTHTLTHTHTHTHSHGRYDSSEQVISWSQSPVDSSWNVIAHGDAREGKRRGNWRMELVASTLHTTSEHGVSSITTANAHTSAVSIRLDWRPRRFKWTRPFREKTKSGFCACAIIFQLACT